MKKTLSLSLFSFSIFLIMYQIVYAAEEAGLDQEFFALVFEDVKKLGGMPWTVKIATICTLIISSMKVSFLRPLWDKLPWIKPFVGGLLGFVIGAVTLSTEGKFTLTSFVAYAFAGAGALVLHQMLEGIKMMPWVGPKLISVIDVIESLLGSPKTKEQA